MEKHRLREAMILHLLHVDACQEAAIHKKLLTHTIWMTSQTIGVTLSTSREINTLPLIEAAWVQGKRVVVPKCKPKNREMNFRLLTSLEQLETVYAGLQEPIEAITEPMDPQDIDLLLVPGLCFDPSGYRIGFGGGYYDRFLINYNGLKVALALNEQVLPSLPIEPHDQPVDIIVTPTSMIHCSRSF